ncbi:MAG TPA: hypothetical protein VI795_01655 [Patescibacteria group bacterium]|nr:hypothetical protein [Patescibacteria group bacterium]
MEKRINLIPEDLTVPVSTVKLTKLINKISVFAVILLILTSLGMISAFVYFSFNLKNIDSSNLSLKAEVASLEKTEQQLILTKDRISKISLVKSLDSANNNFKNYLEFKTITTNYPDLKLGETVINSKGMEISITTTNTSSFVDFLKGIKEFDKYPEVSISSLSLNPKSGLLLSLTYGI